MTEIENASREYHAIGLSVIPIDSYKKPVGKWKHKQYQLVSPNGEFKDCYGIGFICGSISGNVEVVDIDVKYDLTGTLLQDYTALVKSFYPDLLERVTVQKTMNNGYHFIYKCEEIEGNKKLAQRYSTDDEKLAKPNDKIKVLIETRGEGGYLAMAPTPKYKVVRGALTNIPTITKEERRTLLDCALTFNQVFETSYIKSEQKKIYTQNISPFEDFNERGDVLALLQEHGWKRTGGGGAKNLMLRPGGEGKWSADYDSERRIFYVFTTSSEFESNKGHNASQVLATLKFNGDYSEAAKWLLQNGYGEKTEYKQRSKTERTPKINLEDEDFSFVATDKDTDEYITQLRNGTFKMGLKTHIPALDDHWRFKPANLVIINGHDNVGKSVLLWYFSVLSALFHGWKWIIFSSENKTGGVKRKLIEFYRCKSIKDYTEFELKQASDWVAAHFKIIKNNDSYTYKDMLDIGRKVNGREQHDGFLIDPYNSLWSDAAPGDNHNYDYRAVSEMRLFIEQTKCGIYLNCHAVTEALRRKYPKESEYYGYPMPPDKADTEGGGKWSNKADDFLTIHRLVQHPNEWMNTEIHVKKIKEMETGGKHTYFDSPVKLRMIRGGVGFEDMNGNNPVLKYWGDILPPEPKLIQPNRIADVKEDDFLNRDGDVPY